MAMKDQGDKRRLGSPMKLIAAILACCLIHSSSAFAGPCTEVQSRIAAHDFYAVLEANRIFSLPTAQELQKLGPLVTKSLYKLMSAAVSAEERHSITPEDGELPLFEGSLFSTWAEGYSNFYISSAVPKTSNGKIYVLLQYAQHLTPYYKNSTGIMEWKEMVGIGYEDKKCLVDDIFFHPDGNAKSLRSRLSDVTSYAK